MLLLTCYYKQNKRIKSVVLLTVAGNLSDMEAKMRIERVDNKTVKCFISNEELQEYNITYKDFVIRSEKAKEVMEDIIIQAEEELGYQAPKYAFDLQIMMLPEKGMILTFSEKEPDESRPEENFLEYLNEMKQVLSDKKEQSKVAQNLPAVVEQDVLLEVTPKKEEPAKKAVVPTFAVFSFGELSSLISYAKVLPKNIRLQSILYKLDDIFYLYMDKGTASHTRYSRACIQALEFGQLYTAEERKAVYLEEHAECLIKERALKVLYL